MGLSICKNIVQAMGGTLEFTSELDFGSKFTLNLKTNIYSEKAVKKQVSGSNFYFVDKRK